MTSLRASWISILALAAIAERASAQDPVEPSVTADAEAPVYPIQVGTGFDYSRGAYGFAEDTEVLSVPLNAAYTWEKWVFRGSVPFLKMDGPADAVGTAGPSGASGAVGGAASGGSVTGGSGGSRSGGLGGLLSGLQGSSSPTAPAAPNPSTGNGNSGGNSAAANSASSAPRRAVSDSESGLGDIMLGATRLLGPVFGPVQVDLTARVKLPTADDDKGLGTGEPDYFAQADFYYVGERFIPFATLGYRILTDSDRYALENGVYVSAGSAYRLNERTRIGGALDWRQRVVDGGDDATEISVFAAHDFNARWNAVVYALTGFTDASADFGMGASVSYRF